MYSQHNNKKELGVWLQRQSTFFTNMKPEFKSQDNLPPKM
jgi:hypothetical protein